MKLPTDTRHCGGPQSGFTLLETLLALTIMAIVSAIAVPSFVSMLSSKRVASSAHAYATALRKAQAAASSRNRNVEVLFTTADPTPTTVTSATATSAALATGWMVRQVTPTTATDFIDGFTTSGQTPKIVVDATPTTIGFTPLGRAVDLSTGTAVPLPATTVFRFSDQSTSRRYCTYLSSGGAIRVCDPARAAGASGACTPQLAPGDC